MVTTEFLRACIDERHIRNCFKALYSTDDEEEGRRRLRAVIEKKRSDYEAETLRMWVEQERATGRDPWRRSP